MPALPPSRTAMTGRKPSSNGSWLPLTEDQRLRSPSTVDAVPRSMPNSVLVAVDAAAPVSAAAGVAYATRPGDAAGAGAVPWAGFAAMLGAGGGAGGAPAVSLLPPAPRASP